MSARLQLSAIAALLFSCGAQPVTPDAGPIIVTTDGGLDLNDVSWLLPLSQTELPPLADYLPRGLYDGLPKTIETDDVDALYGRFRIVGARIDPCFPATADGGCVKQLRLVAQPVTRGVDGLPTTEDGTIHLFFSLSDAQFDDASDEVQSLKQLAGDATQGRPLDVHPVLLKQGLTGAYATKLFAMLQRDCTNLTRVAFMRLVQADVAWRFGAFNVENGALVEDVIPRLKTETEQTVNETGTVDFRAGALTPEAIGDPFVTLLSESELRLTDERSFTRALSAAFTIENPTRSSPKTIDCGSCHTVSRSLRNAQKERPFAPESFAERWVGNARFDLRRVDAVGDDPRAMRAFGYFGNQSALSQRTINESAEIADMLNRP